MDGLPANDSAWVLQALRQRRQRELGVVSHARHVVVLSRLGDARDQRGVTRFGSICDLGAYEANSITITIGPAGPLLFDPSLWEEGKEDGGAR